MMQQSLLVCTHGMESNRVGDRKVVENMADWARQKQSFIYVRTGVGSITIMCDFFMSALQLQIPVVLKHSTPPLHFESYTPVRVHLKPPIGIDKGNRKGIGALRAVL